MLNLVMGLGTLLLCASLGFTSGVAQVQDNAGDEEPKFSPTSPEGALAFAHENPVELISADERERRVQVCERAFEDCRDWCTRTKGGGGCYAECSKKLAACMKDIPYADD